MDTQLLQDINQLLEDEHQRFRAAFCGESILDTTTFEASCAKTYVFRYHCEEHNIWHVIPAKKHKPWGIVAECERNISTYLQHRFARISPAREAALLAEVKRQNDTYFQFLRQLQDNCVEAQRTQHRAKTRINRRMAQPPQIPAEQIPRHYLIEFATCYRKVKYHDTQEAVGAIIVLHANEADLMDAYHCKFCNHHHVGHVSTRRKQGKPVDPYRSAKRFWQRYPREADQYARKLGLLQ